MDGEFLSSLATLQTLIAATIGFLTGVIGSLVAPWVHWGVEKRRSQRLWREQLLGEASDMVRNCAFDDVDRAFLSDPTYARIRPHLDAAVVQQLESARTVYASQNDDVQSPRLAMLSAELARLEGRWKLI